jgi:cation diffusion facilitator family transporter
MHAESLESWRHEHVGADHQRNERRSWAVVGLCGTMMAAEIAGGWLWGSMALVADGLHMSTHAGALVIAGLAYSFARRHEKDERFAFGTGKLGDLAAFASAIVLAMIGAIMQGLHAQAKPPV